MDLQALFPEPILSQHHFPDIHVGQASDVWLVKTSQEEVIVRSSRLSPDIDEDFWRGVRLLFGVTPGDVDALVSAHETLRHLSTIPVPRILRRGTIQERTFLVVEKLPGTALLSFLTLSPEACERLGHAIASIHRGQSDTCGTMNGHYRYDALNFPLRLMGVIEEIVRRYHRGNEGMLALLEDVLELARTTPVPKSASPIMLDMDPTQFLFDGEQITGLIDLEVYAYGPRELDLIALEYLLDQERARAFQQGYTRVLPFPALSPVRTVYRYLNRALSVQGGVPIETWMNAPVYFKDELSSNPSNH